MIEYWEGVETDPIKFLNHFRCTTEPIGGGTEFDASGELVNYDAAVTAIDVARKDLTNKACEWLKHQEEMIGISFEEDFIERFKKAMEEFVGVAESPLKTFPRVNEFETGASYRR